MSLDKKEILTVIIVNYKGWNDLRVCLESLNFSLDDMMIEVIVVDNQSNDGQLAAFRKDFPEVNFIENSGNHGFAHANNVGAGEAEGNYLLFLNPDTEVNKKAVSEMVHYIKSKPQVGIVSCLQRKPNGGLEKSERSFPSLLTLFGLTRAIYRWLGNSTAVVSKNELLTDWVSGSVVLISREWFQQIGGWNEDYWMYFEDIDLSKKVVDANGKVVVLKHADIIHHHGGSSRINFKTAALTKTEVQISKHVYIQNHFTPSEKIPAQALLVLVNLISRAILAVLGAILFFIPRMRLNVYLFSHIMKYYFGVLARGSWLSPKSMNLKQ